MIGYEYKILLSQVRYVLPPKKELLSFVWAEGRCSERLGWASHRKVTGR